VVCRTIGDFKEGESTANYSTNWGAAQQFYAANHYSHYEFTVNAQRGVVVYLLKLLPPVVITLSISGLVLLMDVEALDVRIGTAVTGLLTLVFLQLTFGSNLPMSIDYLTLMDWIFNLGFLLCIAVVVECIIIRRIYYNLLLQSETLSEDVQLTTMKKEMSSAKGSTMGLPQIDSLNLANRSSTESVPAEGIPTEVTVESQVENPEPAYWFSSFRRRTIFVEPEQEILAKMTKLQAKKFRVKFYVKRVELILFSVYAVVFVFAILFITVLGNYLS